MRNFAVIHVSDRARTGHYIPRFPLAKLAEVFPADAPQFATLLIGYTHGTHTLDALNYVILAATLKGYEAELEPEGTELEFTAEERAEVTACLQEAGYTVKDGR